MKDAGGARHDSYRWLIGEESPAFGGAIRDMWTPTCLGDPGKVIRREYKCSADDSGGVHGNSGVVNHGYALLVDGGTFNNVTVDGIGLDKAANIYWRAQSDQAHPHQRLPRAGHRPGGFLLRAGRPADQRAQHGRQRPVGGH